MDLLPWPSRHTDRQRQPDTNHHRIVALKHTGPSKSSYTMVIPSDFAGVLRLVTRSQNLIFRAVEDADLIRQAPGATWRASISLSPVGKRVYNYLLRITANREDARLDAGRFLESLSEPPQAGRSGRFAPWLYRIVQRGVQHVPQTEAGDRRG
jgi:hypothetical protein